MWAIIDPTRVTFLPPLDDGLGSIEYAHIVALDGVQTHTAPANGSGGVVSEGEITDHVMTHYPDYAIVLVSAGWREDPEARRTWLSGGDAALVEYLKRFW